jgi:hypothetical protein
MAGALGGFLPGDPKVPRRAGVYVRARRGKVQIVDEIPALILQYLRSCRELALLCSQNGWIDNDTLRAQCVGKNGGEWLLAVTFEEVIMEGSGCIADKVPCYGRVRLRLDDAGRVQSCTVV